MRALVLDLLVLWLLATAACTGLLVVVIAVQSAVAHVRRGRGHLRVSAGAAPPR